MKLKLLAALMLIAATTHAMDVATDLHALAKKGDYAGCFNLLVEPTWLTKGQIKIATYDEEAHKEIRKHFDKSKSPEEQSKPYQQAMTRMAPFMFLSERYYMHQLALANVKRTQLNNQCEIPFDCAERAHASVELLALLNPRTQDLDLAIMCMIYKKLGAEGKEGAQIVAPGSRKEAKSK